MHHGLQIGHGSDTCQESDQYLRAERRYEHESRVHEFLGRRMEVHAERPGIGTLNDDTLKTTNACSV